MKRRLALFVGVITCASAAYGDIKVTAITTTAPKGQPTTSFAADTPMIHALFKTTGAQKGDTVRGVWIAEDVGDKAPANTKIGEKTLVLEGDTKDGNFSVNRPDKGWPSGKYRVEIYAGDKLTTTAKFTIGDAAKGARAETSAGARGAASDDKVIKFPKDDPAFTLELPATWTYKVDKSGNLDCRAGKDDTYSFVVVTLDDVTHKNGLKSALPDLANTMARAMRIENFETGEIETDENGNGVSFTGLAGDGESGGIKFVVMVHAFEPQKGKFYAIAMAGTEEADAKYEKDYNEITASIAPIDE